MILIRTDQYGMQPLNYPASAVIESGNPNLVDTVFVDGMLAKRDGALLGHDFARVRALAEQARAPGSQAGQDLTGTSRVL